MYIATSARGQMTSLDGFFLQEVKEKKNTFFMIDIRGIFGTLFSNKPICLQMELLFTSEGFLCPLFSSCKISQFVCSGCVFYSACLVLIMSEGVTRTLPEKVIKRLSFSTIVSQLHTFYFQIENSAASLNV